MPSRVSSKSSLSPSVSSRSSAIDLGKNSGVDLGSKTQTSVTTGGIGVTQEVGNIGGVTVTGGVSVDISPIGLSISGSPSYEDPSKSTISIAAGAEIPGGILGVSGGLIINTSTGQIEGGSIGGEIIGIGVGISKSSEGVGLEISFQIPFTPIEISLGFEFPEEDTPSSTPTPSPSSWGKTNPNSFDGLKPETLPNFDPACRYHFCILYTKGGHLWIDCIGWLDGFGAPGGYTFNNFILHGGSKWWYLEEYTDGIPNIHARWGSGYVRADLKSPSVGQATFRGRVSGTLQVMVGNVGANNSIAIRESVETLTNPIMRFRSYSGIQSKALLAAETAPFAGDGWGIEILINSNCPNKPQEQVKPKSNNQFPPFPNPPPRKRNMDECCRESTAMLRDLMKVLQVREVLGGKMEIPGELLQIPIEDQPLLPEKLKTYPQMVNALLMAIDRHGIDAPITVEMEDSDKTKAGNQEVSYTYNSPGVALQAALELLHEIKADANARLSIQIGLAFAVTRILKIVAGSGETLKQIISMLGLPFRYKPKKLQLEFNLSGTKQGFGKNTKEKDVADLSKEELEQIIPTLLSGSEIDVPVPTFNPEDDDLREMLAKISIVQSSKKG